MGASHAARPGQERLPQPPDGRAEAHPAEGGSLRRGAGAAEVPPLRGTAPAARAGVVLRNSSHVPSPRLGPGSKPLAFRRLAAVLRETLMPNLRSSPRMRL